MNWKTGNSHGLKPTLRRFASGSEDSKEDNCSQLSKRRVLLRRQPPIMIGWPAYEFWRSAFCPEWSRFPPGFCVAAFRRLPVTGKLRYMAHFSSISWMFKKARHTLSSERSTCQQCAITMPRDPPCPPFLRGGKSAGLRLGLLALLALAFAGCHKPDEITRYTVAKPPPREVDETVSEIGRAHV